MLVVAAVWPAAGAVMAFLTIRNALSRFVVICFSALVGFRFVIADPRLDAYRLAMYVEDMIRIPWRQFGAWVSQSCFTSEECIDPVLPFLTFVTTRFAESYGSSFAVFGAVFAFFAARTLSLVRRDFSSAHLTFCWLLFLYVVSLNFIQNIGGFRFNAAVWVYLLGVYYVFSLRRDSGFFVIFLAVAFHYAMAFLVALSIVLRFVTLPHKPVLMLALGSYFVPSSVGWVAQLLPYDLSLGAVARAGRYVSDARIEALEQLHETALTSNLLFSTYQYVPLKIALFMAFLYLLLRRPLHGRDPQANRFFSIATLHFAAANALSTVPSFGRFTVVGFALIFMAIIQMAPRLTARERRGFLVLTTVSVGFASLMPLRTFFSVVDVFCLLPLPFLVFPPATFL